MPQVVQINVPEVLLQKYLNGEKPRELYTLQYVSSIRPDPRDVSKIVLVEVTVYHMARDVEDIIRMTRDNIPEVTIRNEDHPLQILSVISCGVHGGVSEEAMLVVKEEDDEEPEDGKPVLEFPSAN